MTTPTAKQPDTTPNLDTLAHADRLAALATHLQAHPWLTTVYPSRHSEYQVSAYDHYGEPGGADAVLAWARTLTDARIVLTYHGRRPHTGRVKVTATGHLATHQVDVWDVDDHHALREHLGTNTQRVLTPNELAHLLTREGAQS